MTCEHLKVKDPNVAARLFVAWFKDTLDPSREMAAKMMGFMVAQSAFVAHRLGMPRDMFLAICAGAFPEKGPGFVLDPLTKKPLKIMSEFDISETWLR